MFKINLKSVNHHWSSLFDASLGVQIQVQTLDAQVQPGSEHLPKGFHWWFCWLLGWDWKTGKLPGQLRLPQVFDWFWIWLSHQPETSWSETNYLSPSGRRFLLLACCDEFGWYGVDSFSRFGCLTSTVSPIWMSQSLMALLDSAWLLILSFCWASLLRMVTGSWLSPLGTTTGLGNLTLIGLPNRAVAGATPVVQWGVAR